MSQQNTSGQKSLIETAGMDDNNLVKESPKNFRSDVKDIYGLSKGQAIRL